MVVQISRIAPFDAKNTTSKRISFVFGNDYSVKYYKVIIYSNNIKLWESAVVENTINVSDGTYVIPSEAIKKLSNGNHYKLSIVDCDVSGNYDDDILSNDNKAEFACYNNPVIEFQNLKNIVISEDKITITFKYTQADKMYMEYGKLNIYSINNKTTPKFSIDLASKDLTDNNSTSVTYDITVGNSNNTFISNSIYQIQVIGSVQDIGYGGLSFASNTYEFRPIDAKYAEGWKFLNATNDASIGGIILSTNASYVGGTLYDENGKKIDIYNADKRTVNEEKFKAIQKILSNGDNAIDTLNGKYLVFDSQWIAQKNFMVKMYIADLKPNDVIFTMAWNNDTSSSDDSSITSATKTVLQVIYREGYGDAGWYGYFELNVDTKWYHNSHSTNEDVHFARLFYTTNSNSVPWSKYSKITWNTLLNKSNDWDRAVMGQGFDNDVFGLIISRLNNYWTINASRLQDAGVTNVK